jgi:Tol biopolymer transport system component
MSMDRTRFDRVLPGLFDELADARTPDYLEAAIERASSRRQRPAWTFPERWIPMDITTRATPVARMPWRQLGVLALIGILIALALVAYVGSRQEPLPEPFGPAANGLIPFSRDGDLYLGDPVRGSSQLLLGGPERDWGASYSADGTWIGFMRDSGPVVVDVYVMRPDGTDIRRVTPESIPDSSWVQWVPDSRHIALIRPAASGEGGTCADPCVGNELQFLDISGNGPIETVATAVGMDFVQFRPPDGRELLYRALVDGKWGLFAMDRDGSNVRALEGPQIPGEYGESYINAAYTPDGARIFYQRGSTDPGTPFGCCQLWVMNADGSDAHEFVPPPGPTGEIWRGVPAVSPDGSRVAYWHNFNDRSTHQVAVTRSDGTGPLIQTGPALSGTAHWVWAPDSSKILMFPDDGSSTSAYLLDPDGGPYTTVPWESGGDLDWQRLALPD